MTSLACAGGWARRRGRDHGPGHQPRRQAPRQATLTERANEIRAAVQVNSEITARAVKGALKSQAVGAQGAPVPAGQEPLRLKGIRLTRKIGAGGMTEVYLAVRERRTACRVVLKVLDAAGKGMSEHLSRFIQEYTLLSRIEDPNVIRIYDQGFTDDHAYIAMEYFEVGRPCALELTRGMNQARRAGGDGAGDARAASDPRARHHPPRPEAREHHAARDGSVALADFGVAKSMLQAENMALTQTRHGDVVGTPYYLSPEQAAGQPSRRAPTCTAWA
jgi:hypothetical protein